MSGGGGSGGGGGGSAGRIAYPAYVETWHSTWLTNVGTAMTAAQAASPFAAAAAADPDSYITEWDTAVTAFDAIVAALDHEADWQAAVDAAESGVDGVIDDTYIDGEVAAYADVLDDQIQNKVLPQFEGGMRDINAVMSSSFQSGKAIIWAFRNRDVANYEASLRAKLSLGRLELIFQQAGRITEMQLKHVDYARDVMHYTIEFNRLALVAVKEETDQNLAIDEADALWDLKTFQYGANMLGAVAGGTGGTGKSQPSTAQSAIGGALSGAAAGAAFGGIGAGVGAGIGLLSAFI